MKKITPELTEEIKTWLEWSGAKLLAMRIASPAPKGVRNAWPEYATLPDDAYGYTKNTLRAAIPSRFDITLMDEILLLPALIPDVLIRRIIHSRALVAPVSGKYLYSYETVAKLLYTDRKTIARLHGKGLKIIGANLSPDNADAIRQSFARINQ